MPFFFDDFMDAVIEASDWGPVQKCFMNPFCGAAIGAVIMLIITYFYLGTLEWRDFWQLGALFYLIGVLCLFVNNRVLLGVVKSHYTKPHVSASGVDPAVFGNSGKFAPMPMATGADEDNTSDDGSDDGSVINSVGGAGKNLVEETAAQLYPTNFLSL